MLQGTVVDSRAKPLLPANEGTRVGVGRLGRLHCPGDQETKPTT